MFTFDKFEPGALLGSAAWTFDEAALGMWLAIFPQDIIAGRTMPAGMVAVATQRAFMRIFADRPPGNIHAAQTYALTRLPELGSCLRTAFRCAGAEVRRGRRWVTLSSETIDERGFLFTGEMTLIWGA